MPDAQQFQLSGAPSNTPSAESAYAGGLQAEQFAAQMSLEAGRGVERGAQTIFSVIAARQAQQQALANEMALSERQFALRKDLGAIEFQQTLALHSAQDAAAMARVIEQTTAQRDVAKQNYDGDVARYTAQADAKRQEAQAQGNAQGEVSKLFGGAPDLEMSQAQAMGLDEGGLDKRLQTFPVLEGDAATETRKSYAAPLLKAAKAKIVTPEMQLKAVEILRRAGISNPENTVKDLMGTMGAHSSAQEFSDSLSSKFNEGLKGLEPKKQTESSGLFKPGLPLGGGRPISMAPDSDKARIEDYAQGELDQNLEAKAATQVLADPFSRPDKLEAARQKLVTLRQDALDRGWRLSGYMQDAAPAPEKPTTQNGAPPAPKSVLHKAAEAYMSGGSEAEKAVAMSRVLRAAGIDPTTLSDEDEQEMRTWAAFLTPGK